MGIQEQYANSLYEEYLQSGQKEDLKKYQKYLKSIKLQDDYIPKK